MNYVILVILPGIVSLFVMVGVNVLKFEVFDRDYWKRPMLDFKLMECMDRGNYVMITQVKPI